MSPLRPATDAPQALEPGLRVRPTHRVLVPLLLGVATIVGIGAAFAVWVNRQALNTNNWASTSSQILEDKQVQTALSAYLVHELFTNVNVSAELQTILPKPLQPLAGPAAAGLQQLAGQLAPKVLATPQVQATWVQANIAAHKELLKVLNGGGPVVSTKSGVVTLNRQALVSQLAATLGVTGQVLAVQQKLGITVPPSAGQLISCALTSSGPPRTSPTRSRVSRSCCRQSRCCYSRSPSISPAVGAVRRCERPAGALW